MFEASTVSRGSAQEALRLAAMKLPHQRGVVRSRRLRKNQRFRHAPEMLL